MNELLEYMKKVLDTKENYYSEPCVVREVSEFTCVVERIYSNPNFDLLKPNPDFFIYDVKLAANTDGKYIITPSLNSDCIVSFIDKNTAYISMFSSVQNITNVVNISKQSIGEDRIENSVKDSSVIVYENSVITAVNNKPVIECDDSTTGSKVQISADKVIITDSKGNSDLGFIIRETLNAIDAILVAPIDTTTGVKTLAVLAPSAATKVAVLKNLIKFLE